MAPILNLIALIALLGDALLIIYTTVLVIASGMGAKLSAKDEGDTLSDILKAMGTIIIGLSIAAYVFNHLASIS